ncbi:DsbA family oxidoreductase [Enhydrobacter sp.]|jgi:predicted DsbA family dithiol-disulfide isomerase|uniref:DsbA family oxidoreductase n=1 Tax=Enhydrobacter sp. TaxID=1894999 RepID=UPI002619A7A7|nr:DsbA family oxidoreductase [Enhydrobacter sp.]WIM10374.1 MAG: 2-hydroxychromene-2-carboxylate isomerase/DsbA-like thioredoxin domain [Enhydrobacter sp.]
MDKTAPAARIDVISDAICPWCYIGKRQLEKALERLAQEQLRFSVMWHPYQLNPDMPTEGVDRATYRAAKFGGAERAQAIDRRITETAATVGLEFHLEKLTRTPNTLNAHRLIRYAAQQGVQDGVVEALFKGYFCDGADLGDPELLAAIGGAGGLDPDAVWKMLASDEGRREVLAHDQMARNAGIQGVPSFALQGHVLFSGAIPAEEMVGTFRQAWDILKNRAA